LLHDVTCGYRGGRGSFVGGGDDASFREKGVQRRYGTPRVVGAEGLSEVFVCRPQSQNRFKKKYFSLENTAVVVTSPKLLSGDLETTLRTLYQLARTTAEKFRRHWQPRLST
jgi:hypothetical protein